MSNSFNMSQDLQTFIHIWTTCLAVENTEWSQYFNTKACFALVKFLIDGEAPQFIPSHHEMEKVYLFSELVPTSLQPAVEELITHWKLLIYPDPDAPQLEIEVPLARFYYKDQMWSV